MNSPSHLESHYDLLTKEKIIPDKATSKKALPSGILREKIKKYSSNNKLRNISKDHLAFKLKSLENLSDKINGKLIK